MPLTKVAKSWWTIWNTVMLKKEFRLLSRKENQLGLIQTKKFKDFDKIAKIFLIRKNIKLVFEELFPDKYFFILTKKLVKLRRTLILSVTKKIAKKEIATNTSKLITTMDFCPILNIRDKDPDRKLQHDRHRLKQLYPTKKDEARRGKHSRRRHDAGNNRHVKNDGMVGKVKLALNDEETKTGGGRMTRRRLILTRSPQAASKNLGSEYFQHADQKLALFGSKYHKDKDRQRKERRKKDGSGYHGGMFDLLKDHQPSSSTSTAARHKYKPPAYLERYIPQPTTTNVGQTMWKSSSPTRKLWDLRGPEREDIEGHHQGNDNFLMKPNNTTKEEDGFHGLTSHRPQERESKQFEFGESEAIDRVSGMCRRRDSIWKWIENQENENVSRASGFTDKLTVTEEESSFTTKSSRSSGIRNLYHDAMDPVQRDYADILSVGNSSSRDVHPAAVYNSDYIGHNLDRQRESRPPSLLDSPSARRLLMMPSTSYQDDEPKFRAMF